MVVLKPSLAVLAVLVVEEEAPTTQTIMEIVEQMVLVVEAVVLIAPHGQAVTVVMVWLFFVCLLQSILEQLLVHQQ